MANRAAVLGPNASSCVAMMDIRRWMAMSTSSATSSSARIWDISRLCFSRCVSYNFRRASCTSVVSPSDFLAITSSRQRTHSTSGYAPFRTGAGIPASRTAFMIAESEIPNIAAITPTGTVIVAGSGCLRKCVIYAQNWGICTFEKS